MVLLLSYERRWCADRFDCIGWCGATGATLLEHINVIATCATAADSCILPAGIPQVVPLLSVTTAQPRPTCSPTLGDYQWGTATSGAVSVTNAKGAIFYQVGTDGLTWITGALAA